MINANMRTYDYYTLLPANGYGQQILSAYPTGKIKMAIHLNSQSVQDSPLYAQAQYVGVTRAAIDDSAVIQFGAEKLKVLYVSPANRLRIVFMTRWV